MIDKYKLTTFEDGALVISEDFLEAISRNSIFACWKDDELNKDRSATAEIVAVKEGYRGKGYGRAILSYLIDKAFTFFEADKIDLIVEEDNEKAISLYLDLGFVIVTENKCYIV